MIEYKFKIGDRVRRNNYPLPTIKIGDEGVVSNSYSGIIYLEGYTDRYAAKYFELVTPKSEIIDNYEIY